MDALAIYILRRLYLRHIIGERYKPLEWLFRGLPPEECNWRKLNAAIRDLRNAGLVLLHKKGATISLNPHALREIREAAGL